jgi:hypothetical protein
VLHGLNRAAGSNPALSAIVFLPFKQGQILYNFSA